MTTTWEKQFWCGDCQRTHLIKVHSPDELSATEKAALFNEGEYAEQSRTHNVCGICNRNIIPHNDLTIVSSEGEWKEICPACARNPGGISL
jgi:hypothetical protein